ncbi:MAG: HEAT repeat domain-containing protein [Steroidobacteraceae bacterium]
MNCQDINQLFDANAEDLPRAQRDVIDRHLASCHACSEDWANWREIASVSIPATPVALRARIAAALPVQRDVPARRAFRPFVVGGLLLVGAALAASVALKLAQPPAAPALAQSLPPTAPAGRGGGESAISRPSAVPGLPAESSTKDAGVEVPMDAHRIVVLKRPETAADALAIAIATQCHDAIVRRLRGVAGLKVTADSAVSPYEGNSGVTRLAPGVARFTLPPADREIARKLGAANVVVVSTENGCHVTEFNGQTGGIVTGAMSGSLNPPADGWDSFAVMLAQKIGDMTLKDLPTVVEEAKAVVLNTALSERERTEALWKIDSSAFDKEVVGAAAQIGTKSANADVRGSVWAVLRGVDDQSLIQPLLQALANDPDASVRMQAALTLNTFLDRPGVHEALQRAAAEDPSKEPEVPCCILSVRDAAERASIADKDFRGWVLRTLLDESLPARSRLLSLQGFSPDQRFMSLTTADFGTEAAGVVFAIGRNEKDPRVRRMAWNALWRAKPDEAFLPVLLSDLNGHPDEYVRAEAAKVLARYTGNTEVRAALQQALNDASMAVRRAATP